MKGLNSTIQPDRQRTASSWRNSNQDTLRRNLAYSRRIETLEHTNFIADQFEDSGIGNGITIKAIILLTEIEAK